MSIGQTSRENLVIEECKLKVSKSRKQIMVSLILQKNERIALKIVPLRRPKRSSFLGARASARATRGVQGPCARATKRGARASEFPKTLYHVLAAYY